MDYYYIIADSIITYTSVTNKHHKVPVPKLIKFVTIIKLD